MIPSGLIGRLVGATIIQLSSEFNVRINIDRDGEEIDGKKIVEVVGEENSNILNKFSFQLYFSKLTKGPTSFLLIIELSEVLELSKRNKHAPITTSTFSGISVDMYRSSGIMKLCVSSRK